MAERLDLGVPAVRIAGVHRAAVSDAEEVDLVVPSSRGDAYIARVISGAEATIAVTGAGGFLGRRVVERLAPRAGHVRAGVRTAPPAPRRPSFAAPPRASLVACDVRDPASMEAAFRGAEAVVHCAGGDEDSTVTGTRNVLAVARKQGVGRVIHLSSAVVYGPATGAVDEATPPHSEGWRYADWKIASEQDCRTAIADGQDVVVLRPSIVYGPGARTWGVELGDRLRSGVWGCLGPLGEGTCNLVFVDDVVEAIWLSITRAAPGGGWYNINGSRLTTWNEFFRLYNRALGYAPLREWRPEAVLAGAALGSGVRGAARIAGRLFGSRPGAVTARVSRELESAARLFPRWRDVRELYSRSATYVDTKARRELGYGPVVDIAQGVADMARAYRASLIEDSPGAGT